MDEVVELRKILVNIEDYSWRDSLFVPENETWLLDSNCAVLNMDDLEDDEETPKFAIEKKLKYALTIQEVQDVIRNFREQSHNFSDDDLLKALLYYYKNDAFIML